MPITAAVEADIHGTAVITLGKMAAERGGATVLDRPQDSVLLGRQWMVLTIRRPNGTDNIGHLQCRAR
jgi:hypothetical protein